MKKLGFFVLLLMVTMVLGMPSSKADYSDYDDDLAEEGVVVEDSLDADIEEGFVAEGEPKQQQPGPNDPTFPPDDDDDDPDDNDDREDDDDQDSQDDEEDERAPASQDPNHPDNWDLGGDKLLSCALHANGSSTNPTGMVWSALLLLGLFGGLFSVLFGLRRWKKA